MWAFSRAATSAASTRTTAPSIFVAPRVIVIEPGHDAWVVGNEPAVVIEFDYEGETARRLGLPEMHRHAG